MRNKLEGNDGYISYSARTTNISQSLFIIIKRGCDDLRTCGLIYYPPPRLLATNISQLTIRHGGGPSIFSMIYDEVVASKEFIFGHTMMD